MDFAQFRWTESLRLLVAALALAVVVGVGEDAQAAGPMGNDFGLGFAAGNPSSFTGKYYLGDDKAVDFHLGVYKAYRRSFYDDTLFLAGDYIFEVWNFHESGDVSIPFYAGPGVALLLNTEDNRYCGNRFNRYRCDNDYDFGLGPRMPIGVAAQFQKAPFEVFLEMSPTLLILAGEDVDIDIDIINFALGGRFYF